MSEPGVILASASAARARLLREAGVNFEAVRPDADEDALKAEVRAAGLAPAAQAEELAKHKALSVSRRRAGLVIGADQMLALGDETYDKARSRAEARVHLSRLRGRTHELLTAVVIAEGGAIIWRLTETPRLTMRDFSDAFLDWYLDRIGEGVLNSVGAYQLEGLGAHLFARVEGDFFSILGLPLLPLLAALRARGGAPA